MLFRLFKLEWKSFFRSASLGKGVGVKLLLGFLGIYFLLSFFFLGIGIYYLFEEKMPTEEPILMVNKFLLFWLFGDLIMRFLLQNLPMLNVKPLLTLPINRNHIIHSVLGRTSFSIYNWLTLVAAVPFVVVNLKETDYSWVQLLAWLIGLMSFVFAINYFNFWIQKRFSDNLKALLPVILIILILGGLEYFGIYSISTLFGYLFNYILDYPVLAIVLLILPILSYGAAFKDLKSNLYLDGYIGAKQKSFEASDLSWTSRFGALAPFVQLDLKLLWRNKRAKTAVYLCLGFLAYGLIFYTNPVYKDSSMLVFVGIFMTGIFVINFGQFIPAWDSSYFPLLQTRPITVQTYLEAKALLMYGSVLILTILSTAYVYFGWDKVYMHIACGFYNAGINIPIILAFGAFNRKRIDLSNSSMFNYQGIGVAQWLVGIPLLLIPIIIWYGVKFLGDQNIANIVLIGLGVFGLLLRKVFLKAIAELYVERRYKMLEGFKQRD